MLRIATLLAAGALLLAGCVQAPDLEAASADLAAAPLAPLVMHDATGVFPVPDEWQALTVRLAATGFDGGEPTLGVLSDGTIFTTAGAGSLARSRDGGLTWEEVATGDEVARPKANLDPWMWVDPLTDRVYNAPLYVVCTWAAWSDDAGETWDFNPATGCGIPAHDHQKLTSGPPAEGVSTEGYPSVLYYSYNSFRREGTWISQSYDGGRTWTVGQAVHPSSCHAGIAGPVAVGPDGTAYSPKPTCDGIHVAVSKDSGQTWKVTGKVTDVGTADALAHMTDAAVDEAGNAYATWTGEDGLPYVTSSADGGETWSKPKLVSPPGVHATVFNVITAGSDGRVAVAYLGTKDDTKGWDTKDAESADADTRWHLFVSFLEDATADQPRVVTTQVTPDDDPVQIGCIWQSGGSNPCRNLYDFIDMVQRDGRAYVVFADGCAKCSTASQSRGNEAVVAIVEGGPSLLGGVPLAPLQVAVEAPEPAQAGALPILRRA